MDRHINIAVADIADPIPKAAGIIEASIESHRILDDGFSYSWHRLPGNRY